MLLIKVNIGSGNGLVLSGTKPLPEPMLTQFCVVILQLAHNVNCVLKLHGKIGDCKGLLKHIIAMNYCMHTTIVEFGNAHFIVNMPHRIIREKESLENHLAYRDEQ